ncbi:MAG: hypothetical protein ACE5KZ_08215 [Candidatus Scalinduaceae bacterium]
MQLITARITIFPPFRTCIKEGELYEPIEKKLSSGGKVVVNPFEYLGTNTKIEIGNYVDNFRKIRIDITLPIESRGINFAKKKQQQPFLEMADKYLNLFLLHCKTKSGQFWWEPIFLNSFNRSQIWYEIQFIEEKGKLLYEEKGSTGGINPVGLEINKLIWDNISIDIENDTTLSMVDYYFEQARAGVFFKEIQLVVINSAFSFEFYVSRFCNEYAKKIRIQGDPSLRSFIENKYGFVDRYFNKVIPFLANKDLCKEDSNKYWLIDYLFQTRNKIVHTGECYYKDKKGEKCITDYNKAHEFFLTTIDVMEWIRKIDSSIAEKLKCSIGIN